MPTRKEHKTKERARKTGGELTFGLRTCLEDDFDQLGEFAHLQLSQAEEAETIAQLWKVHGKEVTRDFIKLHPGSRPLTWWRIEAKKLGFSQPEIVWTSPGNERADEERWKKACVALLRKRKVMSAAEISAYEKKEKERATTKS